MKIKKRRRMKRKRKKIRGFKGEGKRGGYQKKKEEEHEKNMKMIRRGG